MVGDIYWYILLLSGFFPIFYFPASLLLLPIPLLVVLVRGLFLLLWLGRNHIILSRPISVMVFMVTISFTR